MLAVGWSVVSRVQRDIGSDSGHIAAPYYGVLGVRMQTAFGQPGTCGGTSWRSGGMLALCVGEATE